MISVAMTTYNGCAHEGLYLRQQIDSILNQTYRDIELVICDDNSTDETCDFIQKNYCDKDSRVTLYKNEKNLGFMKNFEKAITLCKGEFIALSDQDDIWEPWKLEESKKCLKNYDLVCSNALIVDENAKSLGYTMKDSGGYKYVPENQSLIFKFLMYKNFVQGATILARSEFLKKCVPIPAEYLYHDYYFAIKACLGNGLAFLDKCSLLYRHHPSQLTKNEKDSFSSELSRAVAARDKAWFDKNKKNTDEKLEFLAAVEKVPELDEKNRAYIQQYRNYLLRMLNKDFSTVLFFCKNYQAFFLDKNPAKKLIRIARRFLGVIRWKISARRQAS